MEKCPQYSAPEHVHSPPWPALQLGWGALDSSAVWAQLEQPSDPRACDAEAVVYPNGAISTGKLAINVTFGFPFSSQTWNSGRDYLWDGIIRRQYFLFINVILLCLVWSSLSLNDWIKCGSARPVHPFEQSRFQLACFLASSPMLVLACLLQRRLLRALTLAHGFLADNTCALIIGRAIFSSHL